MSSETGMETNAGDIVSLKSVHIDANINGLLLNVTTQQHYKNTTRKNLEVVYTFPVPLHAVILGVDMTIGNKTLSGVVLEKSKAESDYEEAIQNGDLPVMVERSGPGLYTANLGNLKRGEEVTIEVRWALLLNVVEDSIRVAIPTVIGKRYGDAHAQGGLAPHQTDDVDILAEYPLTFVLTVDGDLAGAQIECPSHQAQISSAEGNLGACKIVSITSHAFMDRDAVVNLKKLGAREFLFTEQNTDGSVTALASFYPQLPPQTSPIALKILVDCSGSMEGDSIDQAREAVHQVLQQLNESDYISYSRFGNHVTHNFSAGHHYDEEDGHTQEAMLPANDKKIANIGRLIRATRADMGGTEMRLALLSTLNEVTLADPESPDEFIQCVLLITDGNIWDLEGVIRAAVGSGQRIFTIGVGSAPVEGLLRELTEKTGGRCAFVTPNEPMAPVALRMVESMRSARTGSLSVSWPETATWTSALPSAVFNADTVHSFAVLKTPITELPTLSIETKSASIRTKARPLNPSSPATGSKPAQNTLARIAAHGRMLLEDPQAALQTALEHSLVSTQTNLLLVYLRAEGEKTGELPSLEQIKQMAAAGHSGLGTAFNDVLLCAPARSMQLSSPLVSYSKIDQPAVFRTGKRSLIELGETLSDTGIDQLDIPAFMRKQAQPLTPQTPPRDFTQIFNDISLRYTELDEAIDKLLGAVRGDITEHLIDKLTQITSSKQYAIVALLLWISEHKRISDCDLTRHSLRLLERAKIAMGHEALTTAYSYLDHAAERSSADYWNVESLLTR